MRTASYLRSLLALGAFVVPAVVAPSCASAPVVEVQLEDPLELRDSATFAQLLVFDGGCPDKARLAEGDVSGSRWSQSISVDGNFNEIGSLEKADFGFAALLRNANCGVMGFGCTPANLEHHRQVTIAINELVSPPRGECGSSETCSNSTCVAGSNEAGVDSPSDVKPDTGPLVCELELVAAGNFDAAAEAGMLFTGPAVVPTPSGFVVMYREVDSAGSEPRGIRLKLSDEGSETNRATFDLSPCATEISSDGVGAAWNTLYGAGLMAVSTPPCTATDKPRMHVSNFDQNGETLADIDYELPASIRLSPVKSVAPTPGANRFLLAAMAGAAPFLYVFDGVAVQQDPPPTQIHEGSGTATFAQVATATASRATLTDSDLEGGKLVVKVEDTGSGAASTTSLPRSTVTSLAVWDDRAAVIQPDSTSLAWHVFEKSGTAINDGTLAGGPFTAVDLAQLHDYLLIAGAKAGSITVFRLDDASGSLSGSSTFQTKISSSFGNATLTDYEGERVAIAAARGRVVIAWITSTSPLSAAGSVPGGYAVLACDG